MPTMITLNIFSGRPNPCWFLNEAVTSELRDRLYRKPTLVSGAPNNLAGLGYRGIEVRFGNSVEPLYVYGGIVRTTGGSPSLLDANREIERFLLDSMPKDGRGLGVILTKKTYHIIREYIEKELAVPIGPIKFIKWDPPPINGNCPPNVAPCAPPYEPGLMWNFHPTQPYNNCYNYANDKVTNTFAQPGNYHSAQYSALTCASVKPAAIADGLLSSNNFPTTVADGWYVALVIWPGVDFHWYRQDKIGCWSHKPGQTAVINVDNSNNPIVDPQSANRGGYTQFCSYMLTRPCKVRIR